MSGARLGILGGSGIGRLAGMDIEEERVVDTPFGSPSAAIRLGTLAGTPVAFLPRHGAHHELLPSEVPYRANVHAMLQLGVPRLLSVSAVGSLREELRPGDFVLVDQYLDRGLPRPRTFFGRGCVAHVPFSDPVDPDMTAVIARAASGLPELTVHPAGTYVTIDGPQFSSRAESELYRSWGAHVLGMTNGSEARLAREAGLAFAAIAMVTDYDCWHPDHDAVEVEAVVRVVRANAAHLADLLNACVGDLAALGPSPWAGVARRSLLTPLEVVPADTRERLAQVLAPAPDDDAPA